MTEGEKGRHERSRRRRRRREEERRGRRGRLEESLSDEEGCEKGI